jgi:hypothetical protein
MIVILALSPRPISTVTGSPTVASFGASGATGTGTAGFAGATGALGLAGETGAVSEITGLSAKGVEVRFELATIIRSKNKPKKAPKRDIGMINRFI